MRARFEAAVSALCYAFIRTHFETRAGEPGPRWNRTVRFVLDQHARMPDYLRLPILVATLAVDSLLWLPDLRPLHAMEPGGRSARIAKLRRSRLGPVRDVLRFYESLSVFGFAEELERDARQAEKPAPVADALRPIRLAEHARLPTRCEIVVIGSGPGGAITACLLAEAGREVVLLESGPDFEPEDEPQFSRAEMEQKYRNGGVTAALGRAKITYAEGHCVGGGSEINAGLYHRTPDEILERWRRTFGLEAAGLRDMTPHFEACEQDVGVFYMPNEVPAASLKLHQGAQIKEWSSLEVPRCFKYAADGRAQKQSMSRTYLPRAIRSGCTLLANTRARRLRRRGLQWVVEIEHAVPGSKPTRHEIVCETVFVCAGAVHTPALLQASGIDSNAGRQLHMHPTVKVTARFREPVNARAVGVPVHQVKEFSPRLGFGCSISKPPHLSLAMLDYPEDAKAVDTDWHNMAVYYAMITGGSGRVRTLPMFRDPLVNYELDDTDMRDLADGLRKLCELLFAASAETLYPSIGGIAPLRSPDDLRRIPDSLAAGSSSLMTVHLFSSCPMGEDTSRCVADSFGRVHGHDNLHIADASLLCTAPGVNPQGSVMAFARRNALHFLSS